MVVEMSLSQIDSVPPSPPSIASSAPSPSSVIKVENQATSPCCDAEIKRENPLNEEQDGILAVDGRFEGPEKTLEVDFVPGVGPEKGLRSLDRSVLVRILNLARCQILSMSQNEYYDAYVLSESSCFVSEYKLFLKTCGTTTLLRCLPLILEETKKAGMVLEWLGYSRKNFTFPSDQNFPHCSFAQEIEYAKGCVGPLGKQLMGGAYMLGDLCKDHYYVYVADYCERDCKESIDRNINIMMYDLDPMVQQTFYKKSACPREDAIRARKAARIAELIPDAEFDDYMYDPCGYSLNALRDDAYYTIHVTPENDFSYASFETNLQTQSYRDLVSAVLNTFRPRRFTISVFADAAAFRTMDSSPAYYHSVGGYKRVSRSSTCFKIDYVCQLANFVLASEYSPETEASSDFVPCNDMPHLYEDADLG